MDQREGRAGSSVKKFGHGRRGKFTENRSPGQRFNMTLLLTFAGVALMLAAVGVYGG